ncbi:hypothetical protein OEZ85_000221 [Tetradesmus obliquus]|uniref:Uncharacterized protein n=1 Tax=Tetradesmus obliquus TaxID=3088 RepID=A0ABY8UT75_TETOB|nr:hypothetical protein OEZ85_000221 [Tetradesmus obliquus]
MKTNELILLALVATAAAAHAQQVQQATTPVELPAAADGSDMAGLAHIMSAVAVEDSDQPARQLLGKMLNRQEHGKKSRRYSSSRSSSGRSWRRSNRWDNWGTYSNWGSDVWAGSMPSYMPRPGGYSRYGRRWGGYRPGSSSWGGYSSSHAGWPRYGGRSVCAIAGRARACSHTG